MNAEVLRRIMISTRDNEHIWVILISLVLISLVMHSTSKSHTFGTPDYAHPECIHWSFIDPAAVEGSDKDRYRAFEQVALQLMTRLRYFLILIEREKGRTP